MPSPNPRQILHAPLVQDPDHTAVYGTATHYQVSPTQVALIINRRITNVAVADFENGYDGLVFDSLSGITPDRTYPLARNTPSTHPRSGQALTLVHHTPQGAFVPLGATLPSGAPHPHAGTGFGLGTIHGYATHNTPANAHVSPDLHAYFHLTQWAFDGQTLKPSSVTPVAHDSLLPGWYVIERGLGPAIPDGADLLFGIVAGRVTPESQAHAQMLKDANRKPHIAAYPPVGEYYCSGISRWRWLPSGPSGAGWRPIDFTPVANHLPDMAFEPSLIRDTDGSLLFSVRGKGSDAPPGQFAFGLENTFEHLRVARSTDNGQTWAQHLHMPEMRAPSPITINKLPSGQPCLIGNPFRPMQKDAQGKNILKTQNRQTLCLWPLTPDRTSVAEAQTILDCVARFGPPRPMPNPQHTNHWYADHPLAGTYTLADGKPHALLTFRLSDAAVTSGGASASPHAGLWLAEL